MNKAEQIAFVDSLTGTIRKSVKDRIKAGRIPEEWDGHELRAYLALLFRVSAEMSEITRHPQRRRARNYRNHVLTTPEL